MSRLSLSPIHSPISVQCCIAIIFCLINPFPHTSSMVVFFTQLTLSNLQHLVWLRRKHYITILLNLYTKWLTTVSVPYTSVAVIPVPKLLAYNNANVLLTFPDIFSAKSHIQWCQCARSRQNVCILQNPHSLYVSHICTVITNNRSQQQ